MRKSHAKQTSSVVPRPHNYGGQVAPSPPLATSAKDAKASGDDGTRRGRRAQAANGIRLRQAYGATGFMRLMGLMGRAVAMANRQLQTANR
jgi:hypothetical protein